MNRRQFMAAGLGWPARRPQDAVETSKPAPRPGRSHRDRAQEPVVPNRVPPMCQPVAYGAQRLDAASYLGRRVDINFRTGLLRTVDVNDYLRGYGS